MNFGKYYLVLILSILAYLPTSAQIKAGDKAPEIMITEWIQNVPRSKELSGKFVVIDFWATWCAPCLESVPHFNKLVETYKDQKNIAFISLTNENSAKVKRLLNRVRFSSIVVSDTTRKTSTNFNAIAIPFCVVIDDKNRIQWTGHAANLTKEAIQKILHGESVSPVHSLESATPEIVTKRYDSLFTVYRKYFADVNLVEYFEMEPLSQYPWGSSSYREGKGFLEEIVIGNSLLRKISRLLEVAQNQILVPINFNDKYVSYCYKSAMKTTKKNVLDTICHRLKLKYSVKDRLVNVMNIEVIDEAKLNKFIAGPEIRGGHASSSDNYAAIDNQKFSSLVTMIQDKINTSIVIKDKILEKKMSITVRYDTMKNLISSFRAYGIKVTFVTRQLPVYYFTDAL